MSALLDFAGRLESVTCSECGVEFGMPIHFVRARRDNGGVFHCPNGHKQMFCEPEVDRLKRQLETAQRRATSESERAERLWKTNRQMSGKMKAMKVRAQNGVCPCCKRTFQQLARHMAAKHPDFAKQHPELVESP